MKPTHYSIRITPDFINFTFEGMVSLDIQTREPACEVLLNAHELIFQSCILFVDESKKVCTYTLDPKRQEAVIHLPVPVTGDFTLAIRYSGVINDTYAGLYRSRYSHNGQEKYIASTQFEAKEARRAFPCFDQPGQKATFDIEYVMDAALTGISNTRIREEKNLENGTKLVRFERTPPMSTYLVFFGIGEFEFLEDASEEPLIRVATTPGNLEYGRFALDMARKSLCFGGQYTGIPYPLSKCDYIAVPDSMGAMENFGAIRHSEDDLLVYPGVTSLARATLTAKIIAHEGIHMWFGDLVSPAAWKYLWLNEAFATYFTYVIPHHFYPEWGVWEQFFHERLLSGMERDSLHGSIPIDLPHVDDPDADPSPTPSTRLIVYNKGAAVLRMLVAYLGESRFRQAVHSFLTEYQFGAASSEQFWETISSSSGIPLEKFAETWTYQPGYPLVEVERDGQILNLIQTRFSYDGQPASVSVWVIPIEILCFLADGGTQSIHFLLDKPGGAVHLPENTIAYKLNSDFTGFYRVRYPPDDLEKLGELIGLQKLSAPDSLNVINDFFTLVKAGTYSVEEYLSFVKKYLINEDRTLPVTDLAMNLSHLYRVIRTRRTEISSLGNAIFERNLDSLGYQPTENESLLATELRSTLLAAAFLLGSHVVTEFGKAQFQSLLEGEVVHRDIRSPVLKMAAAVHPQAGDWLSGQAVDPDLPEGERVQALEALGNLEQADALKDAFALNMKQVPSSLRHHMLGQAAINPSALDWLWDWYAENLASIEEMPLSYVQTITVRMAPLSGIGHRQEVETCLRDFISRHPAAADSIAMALELLIVNENLRR